MQPASSKSPDERRWAEYYKIVCVLFAAFGVLVWFTGKPFWGSLGMSGLVFGLSAVFYWLSRHPVFRVSPAAAAASRRWRRGLGVIVVCLVVATGVALSCLWGWQRFGWVVLMGLLLALERSICFRRLDRDTSRDRAAPPTSSDR